MGNQKGGQADIFHFLTLNISKTMQKMKNPKTSEIFILVFLNFLKKFGEILLFEILKKK